MKTDLRARLDALRRTVRRRYHTSLAFLAVLFIATVSAWAVLSWFIWRYLK